MNAYFHKKKKKHELKQIGTLAEKGTQPLSFLPHYCNKTNKLMRKS